jgi:hypothetical protein
MLVKFDLSFITIFITEVQLYCHPRNWILRPLRTGMAGWLCSRFLSAEDAAKQSLTLQGHSQTGYYDSNDGLALVNIRSDRRKYLESAAALGRTPALQRTSL